MFSTSLVRLIVCLWNDFSDLSLVKANLSEKCESQLTEEELSAQMRFVYHII
jgi:hypothetical protein